IIQPGVVPGADRETAGAHTFGRGTCCLSALIISLSLPFKASQGDIGHAVGLLTTQTAEVQDPGEPQELKTSEEAWEGQKGIRKDELQTAIELSLQESHNAEEEEREFHRALEASAEENAARMKRKRCEAQNEMCSPADWIRQDDWPVGIRNVGNTCWFSAVIQ
ncbi:ubiquitin carboxyl-terminal hydrolase 28-like, partial [Seriola lalandi dorsalis]|uniref:ubiquitin carboxyl-terminal hydrolase 28-like n=1 Tax=Seriola lalandi dorsalis TaxID=1841481 RepID=UPI000C6FA782